MKTYLTEAGAGVLNEPLPHLREIVQPHGGKIGVRSQVGHGTTFVMRLPPQRK